MLLFELGRRDAPERGVESLGVEPGDVLDDGEARRRAEFARRVETRIARLVGRGGELNAMRCNTAPATVTVRAARGADKVAGRDVFVPARVTSPAPSVTMTSQGTASGRFTRACTAGNVLAAEMALREMHAPSLLIALDYLALLARVRPEKLELAALRWHARFESESLVTLVESQLALAALSSLCAGHTDALGILQHLLRRVRPALVRQR